MKTNDGLANFRGSATALVLAVAGLLIALLCVRVTISEVSPPDTAIAKSIEHHYPKMMLTRATIAAANQHGLLDTTTLNSVRSAAARAPLDARPYLILGQQRLLNGQMVRALATLEAGQRLDPRSGMIHSLLLEGYLHDGRHADIANQLSVVARLFGQAQAPATTAMAEMSLAPDMRDIVRQTLRTDPALEQSVLIALARSGTPPDTIFALASPTARSSAGEKTLWGPVLIEQLVAQRNFKAARSVWQRIYGIDGAAALAPVFNAGFHQSSASAPFNWTLTSDSLGTADVRNGGLAVEYYGRDTGDLASQLLLLGPGRYHFSFSVDPGKSDSSSPLAWSLTCVGGTEALMNAPIVASPSTRRIATDLVVPSNCPAQRLTLHGEAGEFPTTNNVTVRALDMRLDAHP